MKDKSKSVFFCKNCGSEYPKWQGKCTVCDEWDAVIEKKIPTVQTATTPWAADTQAPQSLDEVNVEKNIRLHFQDTEFENVTGGGLMAGSITLVAGEPGIGKSTLFLQLGLEEKKKKTLYISGEESVQQIKERSNRLGQQNSLFYIYTTTIIEDIVEQVLLLQPDWVIIDSIQTIATRHSEATIGSMTQLRENTVRLQTLAKKTNIPIILIGHINKDGAVAGPKVLEHIVDTVILFEGERHYNYRMLRGVKNRFGNTAALGIYEMQKTGMLPIKNPSELLMTARGQDIVGTSVGCINEGLRTFFVEVQALVTPTYYATPQRTANGIEQRKLQLICAVLEKICKLQLGNKDIFITLVAGMKTHEPAIDLSIAIAIVSSYIDIVIPSHFCFVGEVSLSGEIRPVNKIEQRINEAQKTGFHTIVCSAYNFKKPLENQEIRIYALKTLDELIQLLQKK